ncbi:MAG: class B sortase [Clostridia bacterium]|nr:class B sortase [Clostridia bacterium]
MKDKFRKTVLIICTVVLICCIAGLAYYFVRQYLEDRVDRQISELVSVTPSPTQTPVTTPAPTPEATADPTPTPIPQVMEKYAALAEQNPDTIGWLKIEGTAIDYAVMWTPDEPDKYIDVDFYGNFSNRGTLYLDEDCDIWESENLIIYGHHMQSSAMFGNLDYFSGESYWENHKFIQFDTIYEEQTYEIVAAFYARILYSNEEGFRYYQFIEADDEETFNEYVDFIKQNQCYDTGVDLEYGDRLLTLSTCAYQVENGRFAVVAKLVKDEDPSPSPEAAAADESPSPDTAVPASQNGTTQIAENETPLSGEPGSQDTISDIGEEETPLSDTPAQSTQSFSTNMILLALGLVVSGTVLMSASSKKQTGSHRR